MRELVATTLEFEDWRVEIAATGAEGLARARAGRPDVILCDRGLPDMDGLDVVVALAADPATAWLPVVVVSALAHFDDVVAGIEAGAHDYITKPFDRLELLVRCRASRRVATEHRRLEAMTAQLADSEKAYRRLVETAAEGIWVVDADSRVTFANTRLAQMFGIPVEQVVGRRTIDFAAPASAPRIEDLTARGRAGIAETIDFQFVRTDGSPLWTSVNAAPLFDDAGAYLGTMALISDVTARHEQEEALARSQARYRALLDQLPGTQTVVYDRTLTAVVAAGAGITARGLDESDMVGKHVSELVAAADLDQLEQLYAAALVGEGSSIEFRSSLTGIDNLLDVVPITTTEGGVQEILVVARDIGPLKQREQDLARAEERWRVAFDGAPVGIALLNADGRFTRVNPALAELVGYSASHLTNLSVTDVVRPEEVGLVRQALGDLASGRVARHTAERLYRRADGRDIWLFVNVALLENTEKDTTLLAHFVDISAQKQFETSLRHDAEHDPLTGLLNRRGFAAELERQHSTSLRHRDHAALVVLDLDGLKRVNDTLGHAAGDEVLKAVADVLRRRLRATDVVARLGGDEFAVILPRVDEAQATRAARSLVDAISAAEPTGVDIAISASAGVAMFDGRPADDIIAEADAAMYAVKASRPGRG
jgi:diguanylate cyclase (GGDEF)-like protein/PAS domain S-box-containing protein